MRVFASMTIAAILIAGPAAAADVWTVYDFDGGGGTLAALAAEEADSPEPHWRFAMTCRPNADWDMAVTAVDPAALSGAIAKGEEVQFSVIANGDENNVPAYGYYPNIAFDQMFGEWGYSVPFGMNQIEDLATARSLEVKGVGVAFSLPGDGLADAFAEFQTLCAALPRDD